MLSETVMTHKRVVSEIRRPKHTSKQTSGRNNLRKRPRRRCTWTVELYSPGCANVHPYLIYTSVDPFESTSQTASRSVQRFLHSSRQKVTVLYNGPRPPLSPQNCPAHCGTGPLSNRLHRSLCPPEFIPKRRVDRFSGFCRARDRDQPTDRQTDPLCHL